MPALELRLLGGFGVRDEAGRPLAVKAKKNQALLAALSLAPSGSMAREALAGLLWSDRGDSQARSSLRQALAGLRKDLAAVGRPLLSVGDLRVTLDVASVAVDAIAFERHAASGDIAALRRAAELYRGEFLADSYVTDPAFEDWLALERRRLSNLASHVLERLSAQETGEARIDAAKRLVALDPLREASHRNLMTVYAEAGERGLALRQYEICRAALKDELNIAPGEETEALYNRLLRTSSDRDRADAGSDGKAAVASSPTLDEKPTVAVLPLDAMGGDAELEGFCDGLTEDIITGLSRISAIRVVARNTMFTFKGRAVNVRSVGRELGARYVLEGSVRKSEARVRVSAQLIETLSGHHIWAEQIDRVRADMFDLQDDISKSIVASVQTQLILNEGRLSALAGEPDERVSRLLARSWQRFLWLTDESLAECRKLAERALELDPKNSMAHRMVAVALYHQAYMGFVPWTEELIDRAYVHAKRSIELEDADEYCHWAMACAHLLKHQHERALASLRRALEINPNCSLAHGSMGTMLAWSGQSDASIERNEFALRINPQDPSAFFRHFGLALAHYLAGRYERALLHASAVVQTRPIWWLGQLVCATSLAQLGRRNEAFQVLEELKRIRPGLSAASLDVLPFARAHDRQHLIEGLRKAGQSEMARVVDLASVRPALGSGGG